MLSPRSPYLVVLLAALVALGALSTDFYLPALPSLKEFYGTSLSEVQLTLSLFISGYAIFQLICGPLSDRFGRRPVMFGGLLLFTLSSIGCSFASSIEQLILFRFLQGVGACTGAVLGRAILRDIYDPLECSRVLAYLALAVSLAPIIAPIVGGQIVLRYSWIVIFYILALYGFIGLIFVWLMLPETLTTRQLFNLKVISGNYLSLLKNGQYLAYCLMSGALFSGLFAFLSTSSFILIDFMGVRPDHFGLYFLFIVVGSMIGNTIAARRSRAITDDFLLGRSSVLAIFAALIMVIMAGVGYHTPMSVMVPMFLFSMALGLSFPLCTVGALKYFPHIAGTASAMMGFLQMGLAAAVSWVVGFVMEGNPLPLAWTLLVMSITASLARFILQSNNDS